MHSIAIATEETYTSSGSVGTYYDDQRLRAELESRGHRVEIIDWEDRNVELLVFDSIFVSSTWNGCENPSKYVAWIKSCERDRHRRLINDRAVIEAGFTKYHYWQKLEQILAENPDIQKLGHLTPTRFFCDDPSQADSTVELLAGRVLSDILAELDQDPQWVEANIVLKPVISADGIDTFVYNRFDRPIPIDDEKRARFVLDNANDANKIFHRLATDNNRKGVVLQTYVDGVEEGEYSLTILGRTCSHAVQKPRLFKGDGSSRRKLVPLDQLPAKMCRFAEEIVGLLDYRFGSGAITRARVDLFNQNDTVVLCELECVEPNTNMRVVANTDEKMADAIVQTYADVIEKRTAELVA